MLFTDIRVQQYRSYDDASFEIGSGVSIIVGPNGAGKTNLLEAVMVAATGKSYRAKDQFLLKNTKTWARIDVHTSDNQTRVIKIIGDSGGATSKSYEIDEKEFKRLPVVHKKPVVLFEPTHLHLLHDEPSSRRQYIDEILEQYITGYDRLRALYKRTLAQRNALLKQGPTGNSQLFAWNIRLTDGASKIVAQRLELVDLINEAITETYCVIAGKKHEIKLSYNTKQDPKNYSTSLLSRLEAETDLDYARGFTGSGPHRDDISIYIDDQLAANTASRGEIRTLVLTLKIIELKLLEAKTGKRPLLLLDDVFSELDGARRRALTEFLNDYQTLITTTDADVVIQNFTENSTVILV